LEGLVERLGVPPVKYVLVSVLLGGSRSMVVEPEWLLVMSESATLRGTGCEGDEYLTGLEGKMSVIKC
jgi:hypothetical protein